MSNIERRDFIKGAVAAGIAGVAVTRTPAAMAGSGDKYQFEVVRTEEEWRSMFDEVICGTTIVLVNSIA